MNKYLTLTLFGALVSQSICSCKSDDDGNSGKDSNPGPTEVARGAAVLGSCVTVNAVQFLTNSFTYRTSDHSLLSRWREALACLGASTDGCEAVERCTGTAVSIDGNCTPSCEGTHLTACEEGIRYDTECPSETTCNATEEQCVRDDAVLGEKCDEDTFDGRCEDGRPVYCEGDDEGRTKLGLVCEDLGLTCGVVAGLAVCQGKGAACDGDIGSATQVEWYPGVCRGPNALKTCVNGKFHELICDEVGAGFTCQEYSYGAMCGLDTACEPFDFEREDGGSVLAPTCDGTTLVTCNAGKVERIDCKALGFDGCEMSSNLEAACTPNTFSYKGDIAEFSSDARRDVPVSEWSEAERMEFCAQVDAYTHAQSEVVDVLCTYQGVYAEDVQGCQQSADTCIAEGASVYKARCFLPGTSGPEGLANCTATAQQLEDCVTHATRSIGLLDGILTCETLQPIEVGGCDDIDYDTCGFFPLKAD